MRSNAHCSADMKKPTQLPEQQFTEQRGNCQFDYLKRVVQEGRDDNRV